MKHGVHIAVGICRIRESNELISFSAYFYIFSMLQMSYFSVATERPMKKLPADIWELAIFFCGYCVMSIMCM